MWRPAAFNQRGSLGRRVGQAASSCRRRRARPLALTVADPGSACQCLDGPRASHGDTWAAGLTSRQPGPGPAYHCACAKGDFGTN